MLGWAACWAALKLDSGSWAGQKWGWGWGWVGGGGLGWAGLGGGAVISNYFVVLGWVRLEIDGLGGSTLAMTSIFYLFLS